MDHPVPIELEDLILCSCCHRPFNSLDAQPKILSCRHYFCIKCICSIRQQNGGLYCIHCWNRTDLPITLKPESLPTHTSILFLTQNLDILSILSRSSKSRARDADADHHHNHSSAPHSEPETATNARHGPVHQQQQQQQQPPTPLAAATACGENCHTHAMPKSLWCVQCHALICRACADCAEHRGHSHKPFADLKDTIKRELSIEIVATQKTIYHVQHFVCKQREFLIKVLGVCTTLKTQLETELMHHSPTVEMAAAREQFAKAQGSLSRMDQHSPVEAGQLVAAIFRERKRLQSRCQEMYVQCKLDELVLNYGALLDLQFIRQYLSGNQCAELLLTEPMGPMTTSMTAMSQHSNAMLMLGNYCISQLYAAGADKSPAMMADELNSPQRLLVGGQAATHENGMWQQTLANVAIGAQNRKLLTASLAAAIPATPPASASSTTLSSTGGRVSCASFMSSSGSSDLSGGVCLGSGGGNNINNNNNVGYAQPTSHLDCDDTTMAMLYAAPNVHIFPIYYMDIGLNGVASGRILIEVRSDLAPRMAQNFGALACGQQRLSYAGCSVFQCWENESIITGDFELNNGRGGRSVFEERFFMPDETKMLAIRGSVGMRRSQKRHDNMGLVGSQFRIILREMRGFTGIFAFVVDGLELVEKLSQTGDSAGKPKGKILITACGLLQ